ncbi:MAG: hypothetical protein HYT69_00195 [Candidatus Zambryskibacteria bacterium]|nr:hypothetical protein [Candidatus Zambryskibacteria bacterium]
MTEPHRWVVQKVVPNGQHGPYAIAQDEDQKLGSVTFSLTPDVWPEKRFPEPGSEVVLEDFQKKRAGWRAMSARFFRPEDIGNSNQQARSARSK